MVALKSAARPPRSSANKLARLGLIFLLPVLLIPVLQVGIAIWFEVAGRNAAARSSELVEKAKVVRQQIDRVKERKQLGEIDEAERDRQLAEISQKWYEEQNASMASGPPPWLGDLVKGTTRLGLVLCVVLGVAAVALALAGTAALRQLVAKGHTWAKLSDGMWLTLVLRRNLHLIPPAEELRVLPDYSESADSLVAFVRLRISPKS